MSSGVVSVRIPEDMKNRLNNLSAKTRRPASVYVREALDKYLDDLENYYLAIETRDAIHSGRIRTYSLDEVKAEVDVED